MIRKNKGLKRDGELNLTEKEFNIMLHHIGSSSLNSMPFLPLMEWQGKKLQFYQDLNTRVKRLRGNEK